MISLYTLSLSAGPTLQERLRALLSPGERARADRFGRPELARRYEVAHGALRLVLGHHLAVDPVRVELDVLPRGKPVLADTHGPAGLDFSLSHSGDLACIAVTREGPIGVDVELPGTVRDPQQLLHAILSADELGVAAAAGAAGIPAERILLRCWTAKESVLKATGHGLHVQPVRVRLDPGALPAVLARDRASLEAECPEPGAAAGAPSLSRWRVHSFSLDAAVGALAVPPTSGEERVQLRALSESDLDQGLSGALGT